MKVKGEGRILRVGGIEQMDVEILSSGPFLGTFHNLFNYIAIEIHMVVFSKVKRVS